MKTAKIVVNLVVAPIVLVTFVVLAGLMIKSKKAPPSVPKKEVVISVSIRDIAPETITPLVRTFGTTQSYYSTLVSSQVNGEIVEISSKFESGGSLSKGEWLAKINPVDFESALAARKAALANAITALAEEETRSLLAKEDWLAAGKQLSDATDLTLRKPQLSAAKASVESARAAVQQAELDLARTVIRAPFDALVETRSASLGDVVTRGAGLGSLISRERIQVRLPLTPNQASRLKLPSFGQGDTSLSATVSTPSIPGISWKATINRVEPVIDTKNQSVYLVGEIEDPFEDPNAFLPVGAFVNAAISAEPIQNAYNFPEVAVIDDAFVWVVSPENTLAKQPVEIVFTQDGQILTHIDAPLYSPPLRVLELPLASFREGQPVTPISSQAL